MSNKFTESTVEEAVLQWLDGLEYVVLHGPEIASQELGAGRELRFKFHRVAQAIEDNAPLNRVSGDHGTFTEEALGRVHDPSH